jgi:hypothetical protein
MPARGKSPIRQRLSGQHQTRRWLLLVHVLPSTRSNLRVRTWRRLQQLGAIAVKQSVYVLPDSPVAREDFEWLKAEIESAGGEATVFAADSVDAWADDALEEEFRRSRRTAYEELGRAVEQTLERATCRSRGSVRTRPSRKHVDILRQRFTDVERIDFFGGAGRERVERLLVRLEEQTVPPTVRPHPSQAGEPRAAYRRRLWVTRPRPGVDRMASAWLIRRFIDPHARFDFVADAKSVPSKAVPFDMFAVEFSHHGEHCTFETLCERFGVREEPVAYLAKIVHDLDLKDGRFGAIEAPTLGRIIDGLLLASDADAVVLSQGITLFEALYRSFAGSRHPTGSRLSPRQQPASKRSQ